MVSRPRRPVSLKDKFIAWRRGQPIPQNRRHWPSHFDKLNRAIHRQITQYRPIVADDLPDADVVIATWWETAEWVAALPPDKGRKAYFIQHYEAHPGQDSSRVDATLAITDVQDHHRALARRHRPQPVCRQRIFSSCPTQWTSSSSTRRLAANNWFQPVGVMYSIVPFKGCDISLKAFELAKQNVPNLKLVSFGNRTITKDLPLPQGSNFTMQPAQDQIKNIYARCDAWLVGSRSEGFGLPILEAMASPHPGDCHTHWRRA